MSLQYGRQALTLALVIWSTACGDAHEAPRQDAGVDRDAGPGLDAGRDAGPGVDGGPDTGTPKDPLPGRWRDDFALPGVAGNGSRVEAIALAAGGKAFVGGIFSDAAGLPVNNVAQWTGADWAPLAGGLDGWVRALQIDEDRLLWAATTTSTGGTVQRWDGAAWTTVGVADGAIVDLAIAGPTVAVVGGFTTIDGVAAAGFAYHDATGWHAAGSGTLGAITAVAQNAKGFCVAGTFDEIGGVAADNAACWNGAAWSALGAGLPGGVAVLAQARNGTWYAGGTLTFLINPNTGAFAAGIAVLQGNTWQPLDGGIDNGFINEVRAIAFAGSDVLIGGCFGTAGRPAVRTRFLARWSPTAGWSELAGGVTNDVGVFLPSIEGGNDLAVDTDGSLWIGGLFTRARGAPAVNISRVPPGGVPTALVGNRPILGLGGFVDGLAATADGRIVAGGGFAFAGTTPSSGLARLDGAAWTDLGAGLAGIVRDTRVRADGSLAVAGDLVFQGEPVAVVQSSPTGWTLPGGAVRGRGMALVERDGVLWLGGDLTSAGATALHNLARLDGAKWSAAGDFNDRVSALTVHDGAIVAGGLFTTVDGAPIQAVARRTGTAWAALGRGLVGEFSYVNALASSPTLGLLVGGSFPGAGKVVTRGLVRWDGQAWLDVGGGISGPFDSGFVSALLVHGNGVFVSGGFETAGAVAARNLAWFDGTAWHALGGGLSDLAESMVIANDVLYVGGSFTVAGDRTASGFAAWRFGLR